MITIPTNLQKDKPFTSKPQYTHKYFHELPVWAEPNERLARLICDDVLVDGQKHKVFAVLRSNIGLVHEEIFMEPADIETSRFVERHPFDEVPIDTPLWVYDALTDDFIGAVHFAGISNKGEVLFWTQGRTSHTVATKSDTIRIDTERCTVDFFERKQLKETK